MERFAAEYTTNYKALEADADAVAADAEKKAIDILELIRSLSAMK